MRWLFLVLLISFLGACTNSVDKADAAKSGYNYYPLAENRSWIYDHRYLADDGDTLSDQVKLKVRESATNNEGSITYIIDQYSRITENDSWTYEVTLSSWKNDFQAIVNRSNKRTLEMVFPIAENKIWDYNKANVDEELRLTYLNVENTYDQWLSTVTVSTTSLIGPQWTRIYAKDIGLVFAIDMISYEEWTLLQYE